MKITDTILAAKWVALMWTGKGVPLASLGITKVSDPRQALARGFLELLELSQNQEPCDHVFDAVIPAGSNTSVGPYEARCVKCGFQPTGRDFWVCREAGE